MLILPCKVGTLPLSVPVNAGATKNVMSENSFRALRRIFQGGHCTLLPNDLNVVGVSGSNLEILGKIVLRVNPGKKVHDFHAVFCVTPNFALPVDAILGLNSMKELQLEIKPGTNSVVYQGRQLVGMETPSPLVSQVLCNTDQHQTTDETQCFSH